MVFDAERGEKVNTGLAGLFVGGERVMFPGNWGWGRAGGQEGESGEKFSFREKVAM